jgi:DNA processing protein
MQARLALEHGRPVFFPSSMLEHRWAQTYETHDSVYVVEDGAEIVDHLERLYSAQLELIR